MGLKSSGFSAFPLDFCRGVLVLVPRYVVRWEMLDYWSRLKNIVSSWVNVLSTGPVVFLKTFLHSSEKLLHWGVGSLTDWKGCEFWAPPPLLYFEEKDRTPIKTQNNNSDVSVSSNSGRFLWDTYGDLWTLVNVMTSDGRLTPILRYTSKAWMMLLRSLQGKLPAKNCKKF